MHKKRFLRCLALLMVLVMMGQSAVVSAQHVHAETVADGYIKQSAGDEQPQVSSPRAENAGTVLAFTSDVHNTAYDGSVERLGTWIDNVVAMHGGIDVMGLCGDYGDPEASESEYWEYTQSVIDTVAAKDITAVYTTGNHECDPGNYHATDDPAAGYLKINEEAEVGSNYRIYCLGTESNLFCYEQSQISALAAYLENTGSEKPIIIMSHYPLHFFGNENYSRFTENAVDLINVLNDAAESGQKIVFLWGHNHSTFDKCYDQIYAPGDSIRCGLPVDETVEIGFFYCAAGCMCDADYSYPSGYVKGKGLVISINDKNQLAFMYYDGEGKNVTEGGTYSEQEVTGVTIDTTSATGVEAGRMIRLTATVSPQEAAVKTVRWTSSDTSVAVVDAEGRVRGIAAGTAEITAAVNDTVSGSVFADTVRITVFSRTSSGKYYVIMMDGNALSSSAFFGMMSNSSGYEYRGLETVPYSVDDPASYSILWRLEPADGTENGYYIRNYNGDYLSATYVKNASNGYTGTLTTGEVPDVWIISSGLDSWQLKGSYLQSSNASVNGRNQNMFLALVASNDDVDFFSVRSQSNAGSCFLVTPESDITSQSSTKGIEICWNEIADAAVYKIYSVKGKKETLLGSVAQNSYMDGRDLTMGDIYKYRVAPADANGKEILSQTYRVFYNPFHDDVADDSPSFDYIAWAYNHKLVTGTGKTRFNPEGSTTRMNFVMILYKMHGSPKVSGESPFEDVAGSKTVRAVLWAYNKGLIKGTDTTHFSPQNNLSRINIIMILYKLAGSPKVSGSNPFTDISGSKTVKAVTWAVKKKIISGVDATHFDPDGDCSRALFVEILYRYNRIYGVLG